MTRDRRERGRGSCDARDDVARRAVPSTVNVPATRDPTRAPPPASGRTVARLALRVIVSVVLAGASLAARPTAAAPATTAPVAMDFPSDGVELRTLADVVSKRLGIPILYDDSINQKKVILRVPVDVPESALLTILQSALRMKQMALIDADQPGWKQIVPAPSLAAVAKPLPPGAKPEGAVPVTQLITLKHVDPSRLLEAIRPVLTAPNGNAIVASGQRALIVSDYPSVLNHVAELIQLLDTEGAQVDVRFIPLRQAEASQLVPTLSQLMAAREGAASAASTPGTAAPAAGGSGGVFISADDRTNQLIVVAPPDRMAEVQRLVDGLDKPVELTTKVYRLKTIAPERVDKLVKNLLGPTAAKRAYQSTVDRESQSLVVSATPPIHSQVEGLVHELDVQVPETQSPIRFYKLKNTKASDVLATIGGLVGGQGPETNGLEFNESGNGQVAPSGRAVAPGQQPLESGANSAPLPPGQTSTGMATVPPVNTALPVAPPRNVSSLQRPSGDTSTLGGGAGVTSSSRYGYDQSRALSGDLLGESAAGPTAVHAANATVAADPNTNSIIVIAPPAVQQTYAELIRRLDERRPQVQVECTIVTLDTTDNVQFGVDIGKLGGSGSSSLLSFSSFGIATVNPKTGALAPIAAPGGTFALLSPSIADVVLRTLATDSRAKLISAPELLVNDNGKGKLSSVLQQPFAEILDTASVQSRTGLGGQDSAGTTITVEPHISQDDYLQLAYSVELSNFTGQASAGLPPPKQQNTVDSNVTIPDGYTIVVGGLHVHNYTESLSSLPVIRDIPIVNLLFGNHNVQKQDTTLFVFIRPTILRDDKFADLKYLSDRKGQAAGLPATYPHSDPIPVR